MPADAQSLSELTTCRSCGETIPRSARWCRVCKAYTKQWKNSLTYFGSVAGVFAIVASGGVFMAGQVAEWYRLATWRDRIQLVYFEYPGNSGFLNTGSGDVVLESLMITWRAEPSRPIMIPVNKPVRKGEFVTLEALSPFGKPNNENTGVWAANRTGKPTPKLLAEAIDRGKKDRCAEFHFHNEDHVVFQRIASLQPPKVLITEPADLRLNFISLYTGKPAVILAPNIQTAFLYFPANTGCAGIALE